MKNRTLAGLLALILGTFGIHRFYLNDFGGGIFYLFLFFITSKLLFPVSTILGIIEAVRFFNMSTEEFDEKYNKRVKSKSKSERRESHRNIREVRKKPKRRKSIFPKKNPFKKSALEKFNNYDFKGAISDYRKALDISPDDPELHFQIAQAYSLTEEKELAFRHLDTAVRYGLKNPEKIDTDEDLAFLRVQPEYEAFKRNGFEIPAKAIEAHKKDLLDDDLLLAQLKKLNKLKQKGLLSSTEYEHEKKKLMELKR